MRTRATRIIFFALALALLVLYQVPGSKPAFLYAQNAGAGTGSTLTEGIGSAGSPNPEVCTQCYLQLQKDNRNCESLKGQDWQICREAASTAYRQCSQGC
jgi:streptogramin lyase